MKIIIDEKLIDEILSRSVVEILPSREKLKKELLSGKPLRIYIGADPTGPALHIGHATNYIILEKLRKLGHKIIILIGDFTARIGDPTDKSATRVQLTREDVVKNTKTWLKQLKPIIAIDDKKNPVEIAYNHDWFSKMSFEEVIKLASNFTVQRMLERDMFAKRLKEEKPIYLHEFFYPLMQGFDSVHLDVDVEMCGNDQKFNALAGRTLVQRYKNKEKFVFITTLLENPITKEKMMSKSQGTGIFLDMSGGDMFRGIMKQPDENIVQLFIDCTLMSLEEINKIKDQLVQKSVNPRDIKMRLAFEITKLYHDEKSAQEAEANFIACKSEKVVKLEKNDLEDKLIDILVMIKEASSKSEARRLIEQGSVEVNGQVIKDWKYKLEVPKWPRTPAMWDIKVGKRGSVTIKR
ncbi:MAG: tyrosine--tRNA ligase [Patescibacteria group bacterium]|nr:tyrosine--tRNA ligase [Patescibacteria group bacterium]MDD5164114.1 tyrosine--tRNA ligase [Patescibacteria group bacterium]MDD5534228.1 tyrosine--tRNA ligase [Patescibacteria group bacterium]